MLSASAHRLVIREGSGISKKPKITLAKQVSLQGMP
jgi:hypothetical protein